VWCDSTLWGQICLAGDFFGPKQGYSALQPNGTLCNHYYQNQCIFDGAFLFGTNYLWQVIVGAIVAIIIILLCICGIPFCIKKCEGKDASDACCCTCGISESDVVRAPVRPNNANNPEGGKGTKSDGGRGGGREVRSAATSGSTDAPTIGKLVQADPIKKREPVKLINLEDLDKTRLPPGFPPEPPKPVYTGSIPPSGKQEEASYKEYMRARLAYEQWENSLLLWHRKNAASPNPVVW